jgi:transposase-like protein
MFNRFRKEESKQHADPEPQEAQSVPAPNDASAQEGSPQISRPEQLSAEETLELLADDSDPPIDPAEPEVEPEEDWSAEPILPRARRRRRKTPLMVKPEEVVRQSFSPQQRLLLLDTWQRSGLPAKDFADLVGVSKHTLYKWRQLFERLGPEGLLDQAKGRRRGSRLPEVTKRTILMLKHAHPDWGCQRISDALLRGPALSASGPLARHRSDQIRTEVTQRKRCT